MASAIPTKKLFKTAVYTSALIGVLAIAAVATITEFPFAEFLKGMLFHTAFVLLVWVINITLIYLVEKIDWIKSRGYLRYILSYVCTSLVILIMIFIEPAEQSLEFNHHETFDRNLVFAQFVLGAALNTIVLIILDLILLRERKAKIELENAELKIKNMHGACFLKLLAMTW